MVNWRSPEEVEAWWAELQRIGERVDTIEERMIALAKDVYKSFFLTISRTTTHKYIKDRVSYYIDRVSECNNEKEMGSLIKEFTEEYKTYRKSK